MKVTDTKSFIEKASQIHNNYYDYSKVNYVNSKTKVIIICPIHGEFEQTPENHLRGHKCKKCTDQEKTINQCSKTLIQRTESFILKAKQIHEDKYDYSKVNYKNSCTKVCIICPEHGEFWQEPNNHLKGQGCTKCSRQKQLTSQQNSNLSYSTEEFIKRARKVHGDYYDYSLTKYTRSNNKVTIICPKHGKFEQVAKTHLEGSGCPKCKRSRGEELIEIYLNERNIAYINQYYVKLDDKSLKIDFYILKYNLFIEYNGMQHYTPIKYFGGDLTFQKQQERDQSLRDYCSQNNIHLLEISYKESIEEVLNIYFNSL